MLKSYDIRPNEGYGSIQFGMGLEAFVETYGEPEEIDNFDDDEQLNTTVLHYWKAGFSVFFVGLATQILAGIEVDNPETTLFGAKIMGMDQSALVELMRSNGLTAYDEGNDTDEGGDGSEIRVSYEESMMDFFFREGHLVYMNFGVFVDEKGQIQEV